MKDVKMDDVRFVLERFFYGWKMNAIVFDADGKLVDFVMGTREKVDFSKKEELEGIIDVEDNDLYDTIHSKAEKANAPIIHVGQDGIYYLAFWDDEKRFFLFGPAAIEELSFAQQIAYRRRHQIKKQGYLVPKIPLASSLNGVALVYYTLTGRQVTERHIFESSHLKEGDIDLKQDMMVYETKNTVEEKQHLAYQEELNWLSRIENGTLESVEDQMTPENLEKMERIGTLTGGNSMKQYEYMAVASVTLASRAAIRGGVNAYESYRLSELYMQKISLCTNAMEILQIHMQAGLKFAELVRQSKENRNYDCVEQCKDYIARHRTQKFSLEKVSEAVGKNASYLSRLFSEQTGMTMQDYAMNVRLENAANLLQYSNESIGEIAEYLNFSSQSYFGEKFKKKYGQTPVCYRREHKIRDFVE